MHPCDNLQKFWSHSSTQRDCSPPYRRSDPLQNGWCGGVAPIGQVRFGRRGPEGLVLDGVSEIHDSKVKGQQSLGLKSMDGCTSDASLYLNCSRIGGKYSQELMQRLQLPGGFEERHGIPKQASPGGSPLAVDDRDQPIGHCPQVEPVLQDLLDPLIPPLLAV
jgi:hypothetical protein